MNNFFPVNTQKETKYKLEKKITVYFSLFRGQFNLRNFILDFYVTFQISIANFQIQNQTNLGFVVQMNDILVIETW